MRKRAHLKITTNYAGAEGLAASAEDADGWDAWELDEDLEESALGVDGELSDEPLDDDGGGLGVSEG